jgi:hypothetical protein
LENVSFTKIKLPVWVLLEKLSRKENIAIIPKFWRALLVEAKLLTACAVIKNKKK